MSHKFSKNKLLQNSIEKKISESVFLERKMVMSQFSKKPNVTVYLLLFFSKVYVIVVFSDYIVPLWSEPTREFFLCLSQVLEIQVPTENEKVENKFQLLVFTFKFFFSSQTGLLLIRVDIAQIFSFEIPEIFFMYVRVGNTCL